MTFFGRNNVRQQPNNQMLQASQPFSSKTCGLFNLNRREQPLQTGSHHRSARNLGKTLSDPYLDPGDPETSKWWEASAEVSNSLSGQKFVRMYRMHPYAIQKIICINTVLDQPLKGSKSPQVQQKVKVVQILQQFPFLLFFAEDQWEHQQQPRQQYGWGVGTIDARCRTSTTIEAWTSTTDLFEEWSMQRSRYY